MAIDAHVERHCWLKLYIKKIKEGKRTTLRKKQVVGKKLVPRLNK